MNVAAIDIGSNSVRLLVRTAEGEVLRRATTVTGLARGVDGSGRLSDAAIEATIAAITDYRATIDEFGVARARAVATSAVRDAANGSVAMDQVAAVLGSRPEIVSGDREAHLAFMGAIDGVHVTGTGIVVDIGGGSTEIIAGRDRPGWAHSYDIGSVRLTDRVLASRPAPPDELDAAIDEVDRVLADPSVVARGDRVIGVAGTFTSLAAMHLELDAYDPDAVHGSVLSRTDIDALVSHLAGLDVAATAEIPSLEPGRAPVILAGAVIAARVLEAIGASEVVVSESDLLDAVAAELVG